MILALDPGTTQTGMVVVMPVNPPAVLQALTLPNAQVLTYLSHKQLSAVVIERFASYGMAIGQTTIDSIEWGGRLWQAAEALGLPVHRIFRREVKLAICGSPRANDATIRQALLDLYGGKEAAVGSKAKPGPLREVKGDAWSALALALTFVRSLGVGQDFNA